MLLSQKDARTYITRISYLLYRTAEKNQNPTGAEIPLIILGVADA